ncbi:DUF6602 domain-containing protein [Rothia nasimurium]|uniref:DUF6602 domain-containing protein n=1 Tax=Rothia nasimurium TaxID=85336 RepID=UPI001F3FE9CC|nr:DUF6602 domain-containing protein [Rothia nasimurium]
MSEKYLNIDALKLSYSYEVSNLINKSRLFRELIPNSDTEPNQSGHPGEEGRWTESLLADFLRKNLPPNLKVSTGFIINPQSNSRSYQIDILIYDPSIAPPLFEYGDGVIVHPASVAAAISTKYKITRKNIKYEIEQLSEIGALCKDYHVKGPYLCLFGYNLEYYPYENKKWIKNLNFYSNIVRDYYSSGNCKNMNEVIDSIISLDGSIIHLSKGKPENCRNQVKILNIGINWGNAQVAGRFGDEYLLLSEMIEGILKFNKYQNKITWPIPAANKYRPNGKFKTTAFHGKI